ncbi:hypothetical protein PISL3812_04172 [Talaromyces islandicus]|uniref:Uncharacterized protein n=1 Tax=Talaromyces islandicus TaxID=28573 RepID=A0A0U1LWJ4_TALIS|nr:hypothetical protein PISL3812_04172 [Talaromyces islandicus]
MALRASNRPVRALKFASDRMFHSKISLSELFRVIFYISVSLLLFPINTSILIAVTFLDRAHLYPNRDRRRRRHLLRNPHFYPKTVLISGIGTTRGLALARQFHYGGHRVVGVDVGLLPVRSGGSMSNAVKRYYPISKKQYICSLLDIINREKVDIWIPCSDRVMPQEDGMAKSIVESRTSCKCIHFNADYTSLFSQNDNFLQHVSERGLPVFETHHVLSRDSVHRILNHSPNKTYVIHTPTKGPSRNSVILPRRTPSQTYSDVSELQISKDHPWVLKQRARLGKYWADVLFVHGRVKVLKIRPSRYKADSHNSSLNNAVHEVTRHIMDKFAEKGASRMSGHLSVKLMVDEEIRNNSVCYTVYIAGCRQGTAASALLADPPPDLYSHYLEILTVVANGESQDSNDQSSYKQGSSLVNRDYLFGQRQKQSTWIAAMTAKANKEMERLKYPATAIISILSQQSDLLELWKQSLFSRIDPLPWWWNLHISRPLNGLILMLGGGATEAHVKN